jgi:hypothetical protein
MSLIYYIKMTITVVKKTYIKYILIDRYLHGYTINDPKYKLILDFLLYEIKCNRNNMQKILANLVGPYNEITARIYIDLARKYPKISEIIR